MGTSSAKPANLERFVRQAGSASAAMAAQLAALKHQVDEYVALPSDYRFANGDALATEATRYVGQNQEDERFVAAVRRAFLDADATTLPDATILATLAKEGVSPSARQALTVDQPEFMGKPLDSGFSDDPVCTATGHFLEEDVDLVMPPSLRVLAGERTYNSRFLAPTSLGRGWWGWADARLVEGPGGADYTGPDGQEATFLADGDGFAPHPAVEAVLERRPAGGLRLRWRWTSRFPGMAWDFTPDGGLEAVNDPAGGTTAVERDRAGRLVALRHEGGRQVVYRWDAGRVVALEASDGRRVTYRYEGDDLVAVDRAAGSQRYHVDGEGHLLEVVDADGVRLVANTYDADGRVLSQTSPFGRTSHYRYLAPRTVVVNDDDGGPSTLFRHDVGGHLVELVDAEGRRAARSFDSRGNAVRVVGFDGGVTERSFDDAGACTWERRPDGSEEHWAHDADGRVARHTDAGGATTTYTYRDGDMWPSVVEGPFGARTTYECRRGQATRVADADGVGVQLERDADGVVVAVRNDLGEEVRITPHPTGLPAAMVLATGERWAWERDGAGRAVAEVSPLGHRRGWRWSPAGRLLGAVAADGAASEVRRGAHGRVEEVERSGGRRTTAAWDRLGNLVSLALPGQAPWQLRYDPCAQLTGATSSAGAAWRFERGPGGVTEAVVDPTGGRWRSEHDEADRVTAAESPLGRRVEVGWSAAGPPTFARGDAGGRLDVELDDAGRPLVMALEGRPVLRWAWSGAGRPVAAALPDGTSWRWCYDAAGRPVEVTNPDGGTTTAAYDAAGRLVALTTPGGGRIEQRYDADGRLVAVVEDGAATERELDGQGRVVALRGPDGARTVFELDEAGELRRSIDPLGAPTTLTWSDAGRRLALTDPDGHERHLSFDDLGGLVSAVDPLGRATEVERDVLGREVAVRRGGTEELRLAWDADGRLASVAAEGRPALRWEDERPAEGGQRLHLIGADGSATATVRDRLGRTVASDAGGRRSQLTHDDEAGAVDVALPVGSPHRWRLDAQGRPSVLEHPQLGRVVLLRDPSGLIEGVEGDGFSRRWQRDGLGRLTGCVETIGDVVTVTELERDAAGRVVREAGPAGDRRYGYDGAGQLSSYVDRDGTTTAYTYDACGRLTEEVAVGVDGTERRRTYAYDAADQLVSLDADGVTTRFTYDACGRRIAEQGTDGRTTTYRWDALGRLTAVERVAADGTAEVVEVTTDAFGRPRSIGGTTVDWPGIGPGGDHPAVVGEDVLIGLPGIPLGACGPAGARWLSADWRGTVGGDRDPWGAAPVATSTPELGFLGELCFAGLVWLRHRVYDPATRAFLSPDPLSGLLGRPGALTNPYTYAGNDPVGLADPSGLQPLSMAQANAQMKGWKANHWGELALGTVAIAGAVVLCAATGGAAAPLVFGAVAGGVLGGGGTALTDVLEHKPIDPWQIYMNAGVGAFLGAAGADTVAVEDGTTTAVPSLVSKLMPWKGPLPAMATGGASSFLTGEAQHPTDLGGNLVGAAEGAGTGGLLHYTNFPKSMFSVRGNEPPLSSSDINGLTETDPARWWQISRDAQNANWAMASKRTFASSFLSDGYSHLGGSGEPGPAGGGPMTSQQLEQYLRTQATSG